MAWTTPKDWQASAILTQADMDTYVSNLLAAIAASVMPSGVMTMFLKPTDFVVTVGSAAHALVGSAGGSLRMDAWAFDAASDESIETQIYTPWDPTLGVVTAEIFWAPATTNSGNCRWDIVTADIDAAAQIDQAADETDSVTDASGGTADALQITDPVTISRTGRFQRIVVNRDANHGTDDTFTGDAWFLGLLLKFTPT